jgi:hypothetical protein
MTKSLSSTFSKTASILYNAVFIILPGNSQIDIAGLPSCSELQGNHISIFWLRHPTEVPTGGIFIAYILSN